MLPALTTKPKQAVRQVKGLTNDSIDSYANTPLGGGSGLAATYVDNTELGNGTARSPLASSRATVNSGQAKATTEEGVTMARVVRDRKASGEEELTLRTGDIVRVLSSKRTGYLKCEAGDEVGYVPSSYLEFLDSVEENGNGNVVGDESQRAGEKLRKKKKEKRKKEKREINDASDPEEAASLTARSPRKEVANTEEDGIESPRKRKKKERKHRDRDAGEETARGAVMEEPPSSRSRNAHEDTERTRSKSKHSKKKRHRDVDSSASSESDGGKRSARHSRRRRHRRGSSASDSDSTSSDDSDGSYRRRRRRRRHRHRHNSSEDEDEDDSDYKRRSRRSRKRRDRANGDSETEESSRKAEKKNMSATVQEVEKGVSKLEVKAEEKASEAKPITSSRKKEEPSQDRGKKDETERSEGSSEGRATNMSSSRKDDEGRTSTGTSSSNKQNSNKSGLGRQIGEKMRSFLGGGSKKQNSSKGSSGILNACPGTVQGEEGWYEHGENERYYFVLVDGKWSLLYGPMTEDDFEVYSSRVSEQSRPIELPPTYLHKAGYYLNRELRVQKEQ
ncbi:hypothetical protein P3T76_004524 [Phytophthora citrophthora]|uniref:SH3 domain-containing protein n=1 Tax=Phytophthora citrophthora TaxID=4793 RepID=A0AAD9GTR8_9STRA|nr:hypothetical protein P3T76_004524 [Phytophthora citrophthora]